MSNDRHAKTMWDALTKTVALSPDQYGPMYRKCLVCEVFWFGSVDCWSCGQAGKIIPGMPRVHDQFGPGAFG